MIIGTGIDLIDIRRIEELMQKHGARFQSRYFTQAEIETAKAREKAGTHILAFAKRFAAKEACAKALGTGFIDGIFMSDIEITNDTLGKPTLSLSGGALKRVQMLTPDDKTAHIHLSLTDEPPYAQAQVIIEAL